MSLKIIGNVNLQQIASVFAARCYA